MLSGLANNLQAYLSVSTIFFVLGIITVLTRKNAIGIFLGVELMLNAAAVNFVAFQTFKSNVNPKDLWLHGHVFALFIIVLAAIEAAVALAIILRLFASRRSINPDTAMDLKG